MAFLYRFPPFFFSIVVILAVLYLTLMPDPLPDNDLPLFEGADKVVHAVMMMGVYLAISLDIIRRNRQRFKLSVPACIYLVMAVVVFGGCIELLQDAMAMGRGGDWLDFAADTLGALAGWGITACFPWRRLLSGAGHRSADRD